MTFYEKLKALCKQKGTTIAALEREIGISKGSASKWNTSVPSSTTVAKISAYLDVPSTYFTGETELQTPDAKNILEGLIASLGADAQVNFSANDMSDDEKAFLLKSLQNSLEKFELYKNLKNEWQDENQ